MSSPTSISLHQTPPHPKALALTRSRVKAMLSAGVEMRRIALEAGVKTGDIKAWLEGKSDDAAVESRLAMWIEELDQAAAEDDRLPWVETPTSLRIDSVMEESRQEPKMIGLVYGGAGLGKTVTAQRFAERYGKGKLRVYYVEANFFTSTPATFMFSLAEAVFGWGINIETARGYAAFAVVGRILNALHYQDLIIVDEAQHLESKTIDAIRVVQKVGCGICLLGNETVYARIGGKGRRAEFAQLHSRLGAHLHIAAPGEDDIDAILLAWGVKGTAERKFLHDIGRGPGGLRQLSYLVASAKITARQLGRPLDIHALRAERL